MADCMIGYANNLTGSVNGVKKLPFIAKSASALIYNYLNNVNQIPTYEIIKI